MNADLLIKYTNKWVALTPNRKKVIASSRDLKKVDQQLNRLKRKDAILHFVVPANGNYAP